ncbi:MAG: hypothetical protein JW829_10490 [Pirellulales bacterium]|nr:hypothetical protein [Pirellulales bacterium]
MNRIFLVILALLVGTTSVHATIIAPSSVTGNIAGDAGSSWDYLLVDNPSYAEDGLQRPVGTAVTLPTGSSLSDALATYAARSGGAHAESWTYGTGAGNPEFVFDLDSDTDIGSIILWQYGNNGGDGDSNGGNATREFELIFHSSAEGNLFDFGTEAIEFSGTMDPIYGDATADNYAQFFSFGSAINARYVALRIASNYLPPADPIITAGGDRYGLGEVRFATETVIPEPSTLVLSGLLLGLCTLIVRIQSNCRLSSI